MLFPGSRYQSAGTSTVTRPDGSAVAALKFPLPGPAVVQGYFRRPDDRRRLDLIAAHFLQDSTASWRLCDANNAVVADALAARPRVGIPPTGR
jgi:hypothetical protein